MTNKSKYDLTGSKTSNESTGHFPFNFLNFCSISFSPNFPNLFLLFLILFSQLYSVIGLVQQFTRYPNICRSLNHYFPGLETGDAHSVGLMVLKVRK